MANSILIVGESGSGKSTAIQHLNPEETFILSVINKPLPFRDQAKKYPEFKKNEKGDYIGRRLFSDNYAQLHQVINMINKGSKIKNLVLDDFQYLLAHEYMRRASEKGYEKYVELGKNAWQLIKTMNECKDDLNCFILAHSDTGIDGKIKVKTIGKMLDEKITIEGMFTVVCHALIVDDKYCFLTQNDGIHLAKSPFGMFDKYIDNNLQNLATKMCEYYYDSIEPIEISNTTK